MRQMAAWINPLAFLDLDLPDTLSGPISSAESVLAFMCPTGTSSAVSTLVQRYRNLVRARSLSVVPAEQRILDKLVWPLRHTKASYMVANYLAVIALTGMVAEMVALHGVGGRRCRSQRPSDD